MNSIRAFRPVKSHQPPINRIAFLPFRRQTDSQAIPFVDPQSNSSLWRFAIQAYFDAQAEIDSLCERAMRVKGDTLKHRLIEAQLENTNALQAEARSQLTRLLREQGVTIPTRSRGSAVLAIVQDGEENYALKCDEAYLESGCYEVNFIERLPLASVISLAVQ